MRTHTAVAQPSPRSNFIRRPPEGVEVEEEGMRSSPRICKFLLFLLWNISPIPSVQGRQRLQGQDGCGEKEWTCIPSTDLALRTNGTVSCSFYDSEFKQCLSGDAQ